MKKLSDMNAAELSAALVALAEPIDHLISDEELTDALLRCSSAGDEKRPFLRKTRAGMLLHIYTELAPLLVDKHLQDVIKIASISEGISEEEIMKKPGTEVMKNLIDAWREQIGPFFGFADRQE